MTTECNQTVNAKRPETNYFKMYQSAPATIALSAVLFIVGIVLNAILKGWGNLILCVWGFKWVMKGFGSIRWFIIASGVFSLVAIISNPAEEYIFSFVPNMIMCIIHTALLYSTSARRWFREKGAAYAAWRRATEGKDGE